MLRQLLTLLAVLSGLTATVTPAHALQAGVQAVEVTQAAGSCQVQADALIEDWRELLNRTTDPRQIFCIAPTLPIITPTVMLKADRARE